jgi:hypothetical protein
VTVSRSYRELFIYLIAGKVEEKELCSEEAYLGNWLEDAHSFLFFDRRSDVVYGACERTGKELN